VYLKYSIANSYMTESKINAFSLATCCVSKIVAKKVKIICNGSYFMFLWYPISFPVFTIVAI